MILCLEQLPELTIKTILWEMCNKKQKTIDSLSGFNMHVYEYRNFNNNKKNYFSIILFCN